MARGGIEPPTRGFSEPETDLLARLAAGAPHHRSTSARVAACSRGSCSRPCSRLRPPPSRSASSRSVAPTYAPPADNQLYGQLIDEINAAQPAFSIHVGDTKGYGNCARSFLQESEHDFDPFGIAPPVLVPGDGNDEYGELLEGQPQHTDPIQISHAMRKVFWSKPESLGRARLALTRQSTKNPGVAEFADKLHSTLGGATFRGDVDLTGTHNNELPAGEVMARIRAPWSRPISPGSRPRSERARGEATRRRACLPL